MYSAPMLSRLGISVALLGAALAMGEEGLYPVGVLETSFSQAEVAKAVWRVKTPDGKRATLFFVSPDGHFFTTLSALQYQMGYLTETGKLNPAYGFASGPLRVQVNKIRLDNTVTSRSLEFAEFDLVSLPAQSWGWTLSRRQSLQRDFLLGKLNYKPEHWLKLSDKAIQRGDVLYTIGYPMSETRLTPLMRDGRYEPPDGSLRVAKGVMTKQLSISTGGYFDSDVDATEGCGGSPTLDADGNVVGMLYGDKRDFGHVRASELRKRLDLDAVVESCAKHLAAGS